MQLAALHGAPAPGVNSRAQAGVCSLSEHGTHILLLPLPPKPVPLSLPATGRCSHSYLKLFLKRNVSRFETRLERFQSPSHPKAGAFRRFVSFLKRV